MAANDTEALRAAGAALAEIEAYFDARSDVVDGDDGKPEANEEMRMLREVSVLARALAKLGSPAEAVETVTEYDVDSRSYSEYTVCTCPSGDGSLRYPCPRHAGECIAPRAEAVAPLNEPFGNSEQLRAGARRRRTLADDLDRWANECQDTEDGDTGLPSVFLPNVLTDDFHDVLKAAAVELLAHAAPPAREAATAGGDNSANLHKDRRDKSPDLQKDGWIACSERLPPDGVTVLGYVQGAGDPYFCTIRANVIASMLAADDRRERGRPTHWMLLPAAPTAPDATGGAE